MKCVEGDGRGTVESFALASSPIAVGGSDDWAFALVFQLLQLFLDECCRVFGPTGLLDAGGHEGEFLGLEFRFHLSFGG